MMAGQLVIVANTSASVDIYIKTFEKEVSTSA